MASKIFINLPVKDLQKSIDFFHQLGFSFDLHFTNEKGACLIIAEDSIYVMLLTEPFFQSFTKKEIADATRTTEVLIAIDADTRLEVDNLVKKAIEAGGALYGDAQDHGWMYQHGFADLDGHQWEILFIDETLLPQRQS